MKQILYEKVILDSLIGHKFSEETKILINVVFHTTDKVHFTFFFLPYISLFHNLDLFWTRVNSC